MLVAPVYLPAASFEQPAQLPYRLSLRTAPMAELMANPAAWAIVTAHLPSLKLAAGTPMIQPHLANMTVLSMAAFTKDATPETLAAIDSELARLPDSTVSKP